MVRRLAVAATALATGAAIAATPAGARTLYVAPGAAYSPAVGGAVTYSPGPGQSVRLTLGKTAFTTLEDAVGVADGNGATRNTIRMAAGTFDVRVAQVLVSRPLTVIGAGPAATVIRPTVSTPSTSGDGRAFILVARGKTLHLSQLTIAGQAPTGIVTTPPIAIPDAVRFTDSGNAPPQSSLVDHVRVRNVRAGAPAGGSFDGIGVDVRAGDVTVSQSTFANIGRLGAGWTDGDLFDSARTGGAFLGNTYTGKGSGPTLEAGAQVTHGANLVVVGNRFENALGESPFDGSDSAGLVVFQDPAGGPPPFAVSIVHNTFADDREGIQVGCCGLSGDQSGVDIERNNLAGPFGDTFAIFSPRSGPFPAPNNFWGSPLGPFNAAHNPSGDPSVKVSDAVDPLAPFAASSVPPTFTPPPTSIASVAGRIAGTVTQDGTGSPRPGRTLFLDDNGNGVLDEGETSATTDGAGAYAFTGLAVEQRGTTYALRLVGRDPKTAKLSPAAPTATVNYVVPS